MENDNKNNKAEEFINETAKKVEDAFNTKETTNLYTKEEIKKYKSLCVLTYIPIVCIVLSIMKKYKESKYLKFHVNQSISSSIVYVGIYIVNKILTTIFSKGSVLLVTFVPGWVSALTFILTLIAYAFIIVGFIFACEDKAKELPIIGKLNFLK